MASIKRHVQIYTFLKIEVKYICKLHPDGIFSIYTERDVEKKAQDERLGSSLRIHAHADRLRSRGELLLLRRFVDYVGHHLARLAASL